jgi:hypothetical protein
MTHNCVVFLTFGVQKNHTIMGHACTYSSVDLYDLGVQDANGKRYLLTLICHLTSFMDGIPLASKTDRLVAQAMTELILRHGIIGRILSDNGKEFGPLYKNVLQRFRVQTNRTSAYNSRSNGKLERQHREITARLKILNARRKEWSKLWPYVRFTINNLPKVNLDGLSACEALYGRSMYAPLANIRHAQPEANPEGFIRALNVYISELHPALMKNNYKRYEKCLRKDKGKQLKLKPGSRVLMYKPNICEGKLSRQWAGPFIIVKHFSPTSFVIKDPDTAVTYTRHARLLRPIPDHPTDEPEHDKTEEAEPEESELENDSELIAFLGQFPADFGPDLLS